jgi:hypothetical protein
MSAFKMLRIRQNEVAEIDLGRWKILGSPGQAEMTTRSVASVQPEALHCLHRLSRLVEVPAARLAQLPNVLLPPAPFRESRPRFGRGPAGEVKSSLRGGSHRAASPVLPEERAQ